MKFFEGIESIVPDPREAEIKELIERIVELQAQVDLRPEFRRLNRMVWPK